MPKKRHAKEKLLRRLTTSAAADPASVSVEVLRTLLGTSSMTRPLTDELIDELCRRDPGYQRSDLEHLRDEGYEYHVGRRSFFSPTKPIE